MDVALAVTCYVLGVWIGYWLRGWRQRNKIARAKRELYNPRHAKRGWKK